jgi:ABC-type sugar transport system ATPase subunit
MVEASVRSVSATALPLLAMTGICKRFPGVCALSDMHLEVRHAEIHAIVGENGAGKSTLMHILAGVYPPDSGRVDFGGRADVRIADEHEAQRLGIAIVYQERSLFDVLTVAENIFAGRQPVRWGGWIDRRRMEQAARTLLTRVGVAVHPATPLGDLSPAEQQLVEIAKALSLDAQLIIFDEPTAALTETETHTLFGVIRGLRSEGKSVVYISHRLPEVLQLADRITVLKNGRWQGTLVASQTTPQALVRKMVGREPLDVRRDPPAACGDLRSGPATLAVRGLTDGSKRTSRGPRFRDVSFELRGGEIVALAGLAGAGRTETALAIFGARPRADGEILRDGVPLRIRSVPDAVAGGIGYLPEDRKQAGLFLEMSLAHNVAAAGLSRFGRFVTSRRAIERVTGDFCRELQIACRSVHQPVGSLSGGNQQKVLLAKWLLVEPRVLIVDEPTRGVDVGGKAEVHRLLVELAGRGTAVLLISSDLPEVLSLADRILVMAQGRIVGELSRQEASEERILHLASDASVLAPPV